MRDHGDKIYPVINGEDRKKNYRFPSVGLDEFIGQNELKSKLEIYIQAARKRSEPLDHCLFYGPPGQQNDPYGHHRQRDAGQLRITSGPALERTGDLAPSNLNPGMSFL